MKVRSECDRSSFCVVKGSVWHNAVKQDFTPSFQCVVIQEGDKARRRSNFQSRSAERLDFRRRREARLLQPTGSFPFRAPSRHISFLACEVSKEKVRSPKLRVGSGSRVVCSETESPHCGSELRSSVASAALLIFLSRCRSRYEARLPSELGRTKQLLL